MGKQTTMIKNYYMGSAILLFLLVFTLFFAMDNLGAQIFDKGEELFEEVVQEIFPPVNWPCEWSFVHPYKRMGYYCVGE